MGEGRGVLHGARRADRKAHRKRCVVHVRELDGLTFSVRLGADSGGLGSFGYMWECPDLFSLDGTDVLLVCPQGLEADGIKYHNSHQAGYFLGRLHTEPPEFKHGEFTELDRGFDFYAAQTLEDDKGRRILFAWMGVPDQHEDKHPTHAYH